MVECGPRRAANVSDNREDLVSPAVKDYGVECTNLTYRVLSTQRCYATDRVIKLTHSFQRPRTTPLNPYVPLHLANIR